MEVALMVHPFKGKVGGGEFIVHLCWQTAVPDRSQHWAWPDPMHALFVTYGCPRERGRWREYWD